MVVVPPSVSFNRLVSDVKLGKLGFSNSVFMKQDIKFAIFEPSSTAVLTKISCRPSLMTV